MLTISLFLLQLLLGLNYFNPFLQDSQRLFCGLASLGIGILVAVRLIYS